MELDLSNGNGTTRPTLNQLLARDRAQHAQEDMSVRRSSGSSDIGILSRTLIPSSMTKWILPICFMAGSNMQLLFVGENYIHIKEVVPDVRVDYRLHQRQTISFISSPIRAVALIGRPTGKQPSRDDTRLPSIFETMTQVDTPEQGLQHQDYPIQIIAVVLESGFLQLMTPDFKSKRGLDYLTFKMMKIPLCTPEPRALSPGARIAVDPYSRAFAVAAAFDTIVLYNNHKSDLLAVTIAADNRDWNPISDEQILHMPGCIVGIDFLNAGPFSQEVVMVVITATGRRNNLTCIAWDHHDFHSRRLVAEMKIPPQTGSLCNMIIPMANTPDFLLIHGDIVNLYTNILSGLPKVDNIMNKGSHWDAEPSFPASSKRRPHFTAWARPIRPPGIKIEFIHLMREDGAVRYYRRHPTNTMPSGETGNSGIMDCHANTAFASFSPTSNGPDYLVAAGDMGLGEFHSVGVNVLRKPLADGSRKDMLDFVKQASLPDWAPVMDMQIMQDGEGRGRPVIITTSGRQPFGALTQLHVGCEAHVAWMTDLSEMDEALIGANNMWVLDDAQGSCMHCICSYPDHTAAVCVLDDDEIVSSTLHIDYAQETLLACVVHEGIPGNGASSNPVVVLVTASAVILQRFEDTDAVTLTWDDTITSAASDGKSLLIITRNALHTTCIQRYEIDRISMRLDKRGTTLYLEHEITALHCSVLDSASHVMLATRNGDLHIFKELPVNGELKKVFDTSFGRSIIQNVALVSLGAAFDPYVICGTRDGELVALRLHLSHPKRQNAAAEKSDGDESILAIRAEEPRIYKIGHAPVNVIRSPNAWPRVFVLCGGETLVVDLNSHPIEFTFTNIVFTTENDTAFRLGSLAAIAALPALAFDPAQGIVENKDSQDARLVCHDGQNLILATMLAERQVLPRRLPLRKHQVSLDEDQPPQDLSGTPTKLLYSNTLDAIIATGVKYEHRPSRKVPEPAWQGKRVSRGFIIVLPGDGNQGMSSNDITWNQRAVHVDFAPAERVLCACEWIYKSERTGNKHPFIVLGTSISDGELRMVDGRRQRVQKGRLWLLIPSRSKTDGSVQLELKYIKHFDQPVKALAVLDDTKLVVAPLGELRVYTFASKNSFSQLCKLEIPSPATYITTNALRHIIVTTSRHSTCGYELKGPTGDVEEEQGLRLEQLFTDNMERNGITHVVLELQIPKQGDTSEHLTLADQSQGSAATSRLSILLGADRKGQVFGLDVPKVRRNQNAAPTAFELRLPQSITKFSRGMTRAPWYERRVPIAGVLVDDIAGATTDGTVYHFTMLTPAARLLLKFLENLVNWNELEDYRTSWRLTIQKTGSARSDQSGKRAVGLGTGLPPEQGIIIDPEYVPGEAGQRHRRDQYGINGDLLLPLLDHKETRGLRLLEMLNREEMRTSASIGYGKGSRHAGNQVDERWRKFDELVERVVQGVDGKGALERNTPVVIEACIAWLEEIMRPVL